VKAIVSDDCITYVVSNDAAREALLVDPKLEVVEQCKEIAQELNGYLWLAVVDTHTHADHVTTAPQLADFLSAPLVMHELSPSRKVGLRISRRTFLPSHAAKLELIPTPGHTPDGITAVWGPFALTGDTVFYADVGRDDLPGGDPSAHFTSLETLTQVLKPESILLPGHDFKGGRASTWATQLKINSSLTQARDEFVAEAAAYDAPAPKAFKKSLFENFK
jgi:glyoxylase-like metal-dependent hydrolase (beta-lactamase superfamily II)